MELRTTGTVEIFKGMAGRTTQKYLGMDCCFEFLNNLAAQMRELLLIWMGQRQFPFKQNASLKFNAAIRGCWQSLVGFG